MKKIILSNIEHYVVKDERIVKLLLQLRSCGRKTFLLTNSEYSYTNVSFYKFSYDVYLIFCSVI